MTRPTKRRHVTKILLFLLLLAAGALWHFSLPPSVGGGQADSVLARWVKNRIYAKVSPLDEQGYSRLTAQNANGWYSTRFEPIQSLEYYQSQHPMRPTSQRRTIVLQPIGEMTTEQQALLAQLKEYCEAFFQLPVRIESPLSLDLAKQWTRPGIARGTRPAVGTGQYNAGKIVQHVLVPRLPQDAAAYLGITMADLWTGDLNYVFGLGSFEHRAGVYSLCRYYPQFWGRKSEVHNQTQILRRACLVLNHEAGHMFGLMHCVLYKCAMNGSNSLQDADSTPIDYCPVCSRKLLWNIGCDGTRRYRDLLRFYQQHGLLDEARWTTQRLMRWQQLDNF